jgi:ABC-2 type transport system ATP-binding protein
VEVSAPDLEKLVAAIHQYTDVKDVQVNQHMVVVHLNNGKSAYDLNTYLAENGIVVSHLATERKNLEAQFLEILSQSK